MIIAINFANEKFELNRKQNTLTAYKHGEVDKVIEYSPNDIDLDFISNNNKILSIERGAGLWLWKPYFILKTLNNMDDGDYLFYSDSGALYVNKISYLTNVLSNSNQSIMGFELPLIMRQFTKRETFKLMNSATYDENQNLATFILLKKDAFSIKFCSEWLTYCCDERIISPKHFIPEIKEFDDFVDHREDQSVFSILYKKYSLQSYRDPSQFGLRPFEYLWITKYIGKWKEWIYNPLSYEDSFYPKILILNRSAEPRKYRIKELIKDVLWRVGIYNEKLFRYKNIKD